MGKKGKLFFKGDKPPKKKSKKFKISKGGSDERATDRAESQSSSTYLAPPAREAASIPAGPTIEEGTGQITTSGTVVSGNGTKFESEISIGDAILVRLPKSKAEEMRVVTMRISNISLNLSSAFSENLSEPQIFRFVGKPRNLEEERRKERQKQLEEANETEKSVYDIYGNQTLTYREKTETGSYRLKQQQLSKSSESTTRADLLAMRSKKTSDKYC